MSATNLAKPLSQAAYRESFFPALRLVKLSRRVYRVAQALLVLLAGTLMAMFFLPWQQTVVGSGNVVAFAPLERQQTVQAPIKGRIVSWGENIRENVWVKKGEKILEIQDIDPQYLQRLQNQVDATSRQLEANREQLAALERQLAANQTIVETYEAQVTAFTSVRDEIVAAADEYIKMASQKVKAEEESLAASVAAEAQAKADFERQKTLFEEGLASELKMQLAERKDKEALAKVKQREAYVQAAKNELQAKRNERTAKEQEAQTKIDSAEAYLRKARSDIAKAESEIAKAQSEVTKTEKELLEMEVKLARQQSQTVVAPRDGYIMKLFANQGGEIVKQGDPLLLFVPETKDRAVQIWVNGNDAPLIEPGRHVRIQFEGWPALQFSGWPSVAVGTFGGRVAAVDATDDGNGQFRILVVPDPNDSPWPSNRYLRQGVRANAWVLLDQVSLGYEFWRRMNGFPPAINSKKPQEVKVPDSLKKMKP